MFLSDVSYNHYLFGIPNTIYVSKATAQCTLIKVNRVYMLHVILQHSEMVSYQGWYPWDVTKKFARDAYSLVQEKVSC